MSEKIEPALSAEEWAEKRASRSDSWDNEVAIDENGLLEVADDYGFRAEGRHALAALALHGQPFGFTWAMRDALKAMWIKLDNEGWGDLATTAPDSPHRLAGDAIDCIASLLPPREP